jgi:hypothetical protein
MDRMDLMDGMDPEGEAPPLMRATGSSPLSSPLSPLSLRA